MHKNIVRRTLLKGVSQDNHLREWIGIHCDRMPQSYFDRFSYQDVHKHILLIQELSQSLFFNHFLEKMEEKSCFCLTLVSYDFPWLMVALTGNMSLYHFNIYRGAVFNYGDFYLEKKENFSYEQQRKKMVTVLEIHYGKDQELFESDYNSFLEGMRSFFQDAQAGKIDETRFTIISKIGKRFSNLPLEKETVLLRMNIDVEVRAQSLILSIFAQDTPFFLFSLSLALRAQNIDIDEIEINTKSGCVEDIVIVHDLNNVLHKDPSAIKRLKIVLALIKYFTYLLPSALDFNHAFRHFELFVDQILHTGNEAVEDMSWLNPEELSSFVAIFQSGTYMMEQFVKMQYKMFMPFFENKSWIARRESFLQEFDLLSQKLIQIESLEEYVDCVNVFKDKQLFFLDLCHLVYPHYSFDDFGKDLSVLAQNVLKLIAIKLWKHLCKEKGTPMYEGRPCRYALMRLGKWGGDELGYASDLEIVFIYEGYGQTDSDQDISNQEFFNIFMKQIKESVRAKSEQIFELDVRLRPYGAYGPLSTSQRNWKEYYTKGASQEFERYSLCKMSGVLGDEDLIKDILECRNKIVYLQGVIDSQCILDIRDTQKKTKLKLGRVNAKFSPGTLVELEYSVQFLQIKHGFQYKNLQSTNTFEVMRHLLRHNLITPRDYERLSNAYSFFRMLINVLRMVRGHAGDLEIPLMGTNEFFFLARRMKYQKEDNLHKDMLQHMQNIENFFKKVIQDIVSVEEDGLTLSDIIMSQQQDKNQVFQILKKYNFLRVKAVYKSLRDSYLFVQDKPYFVSLILIVIRRIHDSPDPDQVIFYFERLFKNASLNLLKQLFYDPKTLDCMLSIFGQSDFLSYIVISDKKALDEVFKIQLRSMVQNPQDWFECFKKFQLAEKTLEDYFDELRQYRNRLILRIALRDFLGHIDFLHVIQELSYLADVIIDSVFRKIAEKENCLFLYEQQVIIALGKMGGEELNYSSDIDLLFVARQDISADEMMLLRKLQEKLIEHLTQSTGYFSLYRVDMRLRPHGAAGSLVFKENSYRNYYQKDADGWELQAWLKARPVSGNIHMGRSLIRDVQKILFHAERRDSISESIKSLRYKKCDFLKKKNILYRDVKSGIGGIRDIEFYVQSLQLCWGEVYPDLISGHTLHVLDRLMYHKICAEELILKIKKNYIFLRKIEHSLQIFGMRQNHLIPDKPRALSKLAKQMGYRSLLNHSAEDLFLKDHRLVQDFVKQLSVIDLNKYKQLH